MLLKPIVYIFIEKGEILSSDKNFLVLVDQHIVDSMEGILSMVEKGKHEGIIDLVQEKIN